MFDGSLKIPKKQVPVNLWVHPEGRVVASVFLHLPGPDQSRAEEPWDVLNQSEDFLVVQREDPDELRFYNKACIIRVEYWDGTRKPSDDGLPVACRIHLMDGSLVSGEICKALPPERSRLYDYMNDVKERFLKLHLGDGEINLINKSYVAFITSAGKRVVDTFDEQTVESNDAPLELDLAA